MATASFLFGSGPARRKGKRAHVSLPGSRLFAAALTIGALAAGYMTWEGLRYLRIGLVGNRPCSFSAWVNCDGSISSPEAFVWGVPIAWIALLFFFSMAALWGIASRFPSRAPAILPAAAVLGLAGAGVSLRMLAVLVLKIKAICLPCAIIQMASICACAILLTWLCATGRRMWLSSTVWFAAAMAIYGGGIAAWLNVEGRLLEPKPLDVAAEVRRHFSAPKLIDDTTPLQATNEPDNDRVRIECFMDYQCPQCRRVAALLPGWLGQLRKNCQIVNLQFPLDASVNPYKQNGKHAQAGIAAKAAICFDQLGALDIMQRRMFHSQEDLSLPTILKLADKEGINTNLLIEMMASKKTQQTLSHHLELAHSAGVSATPSVFVEGRRLALYYEPEILRSVVTADLSKRGKLARIAPP